MMKTVSSLDLLEESFSLGNTSRADACKLPFQIPSCGYFQAKNTYFTEREGLENHLLLYTISGTGLLDYNGKNYTLNPGQAIVFDCNPYQFYRSKSNWVFKWIHFTGSAAEEYTSRIHRYHLEPIPMKNTLSFEQLISQMFDLMKEKPLQIDILSNLLMTRILTEMILSVDESLTASRNPSHQRDVEMVIQLIEDRYTDKIHTEQLISPSHISPWYFTRLFKEHTGRSPYEYLVQHRLNKAVEDLLQTDVPINEIAMKNGFGDSTQFIRRFRQYYGTTPAVFRKNVR